MTRVQDKSFIRRFANFPFFLLLIGLYPILYLLNTNLGQTTLTAAGSSVLIALVISLFISGACLLFFRPVSRAYLAAILLNTAFFTYGHLFNLIDAKTIGGFLVGRHMLFLPVFTLVFSGLFVFIMKRPAPKETSVRTAANVIVLGLSIIQAAGIGIYNGSVAQQEQAEVAGVEIVTSSVLANESGPDIYYIILDGMAREDVIRTLSGELEYNLPEGLEKRGFYIPKCAFSNYGGTSISLSSSLNLNYLDQLGIEDALVNTDENDPAVLYNLLHQNLVVSQLKQQGYQFVAFRGFFPLNDFQEADHYFNFHQDQKGFDDLGERSFRDMFIRTTLLRLPAEMFEGNPQQYSFVPKPIAELIAPEAGPFSSRSYRWYQEHIYSFNKLETVPALPGKKFVYAHFYTTHQPYVLKPDGSLLWPINEANDGYISAVQYTSERILQVIDRILAESEQPPIIVVQADHGIGTGLDRYKILNAYFLPSGNQNLYDTITPVNTFRLIFNQYNDGQYELLPDIIMRGQSGGEQFEPLPVRCDLE